MNRYLKTLVFILLLITAGLACNFPGVVQDEPVVNGDPPVDLDPVDPGPVITQAPPSSPPGDYPDLIVDDISIESTSIVREADPWVWITFRVTNIGTTPSPQEITADMILDGVDTGGYFSVEGGPLQPGELTTHRFAVGHNDFWTFGNHTVEVAVDYNNVIPESDDNNNLSTPIDFEVVAP